MLCHIIPFYSILYQIYFNLLRHALIYWCQTMLYYIKIYFDMSYFYILYGEQVLSSKWLRLICRIIFFSVCLAGTFFVYEMGCWSLAYWLSSCYICWQWELPKRMEVWLMISFYFYSLNYWLVLFRHDYVAIAGMDALNSSSDWTGPFRPCMIRNRELWNLVFSFIRSWPQLNIRPFTRHETKDFLNSSWKNETISFSPEMVITINVWKVTCFSTVCLYYYLLERFR